MTGGTSEMEVVATEKLLHVSRNMQRAHFSQTFANFNQIFPRSISKELVQNASRKLCC